MTSKITVQKVLNQLDIIDFKADVLQRKSQRPAIISISGLRNLSICKMSKQPNPNYKELVYTLFELLNISTDWILSISCPPSNPNCTSPQTKIPFEANIRLVSDSIKLRVFKLLLNHIQGQPNIHLKISHS